MFLCVRPFALSKLFPGFVNDVASVCAFFLLIALVLSDSCLRHLGNFEKNGTEVSQKASERENVSGDISLSLHP